VSGPRFITADAARDERSEPWQLVMPRSIWQQLNEHLFPGDHGEHGAVATAGLVQTARGTRILVRELFCARDGVDFVPAKHAHRRLTPTFVNERIRYCRDHGLAYLAIHNHGGTDSVGFSSTDLQSHERGYPALLDIARGQPVGALVLARGALAGDIWTSDGKRRPIGETVIPGRNLERLYPERRVAPRERCAIDDRQARIYGDAGQALLARLKVGVIGAGGVGLPIVATLARLGVGHVVVVDPERVDLTNLPRLPESTRRDAMTFLTSPRRPAWIQQLGQRLTTPKVRLAQRVAHRARTTVHVDGLRCDAMSETSIAALMDCDYLFLAADSHVARAAFNMLVHQYLIPGVQVGSKVEIDPTDALQGIYSVVRPVYPDSGCLWCNGLISASRITDESLPNAVRNAQAYLPSDDAPAPSVITLNALGVAQATNHFMLAATGLLQDSPTAGDYRRYEARSERTRTEIPRQDPACIDCGLTADSVRARGMKVRWRVASDFGLVNVGLRPPSAPLSRRR